MMPPPLCLLYSQDPELVRRVKAYVRSLAELRQLQDPARLDIVLQQAGPAVLIIDLRARESSDVLDQVQRSWPQILVVALGTLRSEPLRDAEQSGIYAAEDIQLDRRRFQALVLRAFEHLRILEENRDLRQESTLVPIKDTARYAAPPVPFGPSPLSLSRIPKLFRRHDSVDALLKSIVETIADTTGVTRLGIFARTRQGEMFRLRAGLRCFPETFEIEYSERDPLVRFFELEAHLISSAHLAHQGDRGQRAVLRRALSSFGAEVIIPLFARGQLTGWLFCGHRVTGVPFDERDLEGLTILAEHVSTVLENALLNEDAALQRTLAETLLKAIPPGIVATDDQGTVRWYNPTAEDILGVPSENALNRPVENLGTTVATAMRDALETSRAIEPRQWIDRNTRRSLSVEVRRLTDQGTSLGAVAVINDLTAEDTLRQKQDLVDRAAFWTDLAASMSHEIRNPLVAIKTFAQLLPERFEDSDFRRDFNQIVLREIDRLDKIITQINNFAHPPELEFKPVDLRTPVKKALEIARDRFAANGQITVETSLPNDLPKVMGDESALAEAFAHLVANAAEATAEESEPRITLSAKTVREGKAERASGVVVTVRDNGHGIAPDLRDKIFSPFCTTKPRGMGLGLPIVKRTVFDHNGRVDVDSSSQGTLVSVVLPASSNGH